MQLLVAVLSVLALGQEDEKPYTPKHKIDFKLTILEQDGAWQWVIEGTTDLPEDTVLRARALAYEVVDDFRGGRRIDEEPLSTKQDCKWHEFSPKGRKFREALFEARRRPYSLPYRARIEYRQEDQPEGLAAKVGEKDFSVFTDLRRGTEADLDRELKATLKELGSDLEEIQKLFQEFKAHFLEQQKKYDAKVWNKWSAAWLERVRAVADRNEDRWRLWCVWLERQGQMRVEGFCDAFVQMASHCSDALKGDNDAMANLQRSFEYFLAAFEAALDAIGIDTPLNPDALSGHLQQYEDAMTRLRGLLQKTDRATWEKDGESLRASARSAILALSSQKLVPRRGYERVAALGDLFRQIHDLADRVIRGTASAEDAERVRKLLDEHDQKLRDFKKYAGIVTR